MILGLDFYDTVSAWPVALRKLAQSVLDAGGEVHIVTAVKRANEDKVRRHIKDSRLPHTSIQVVFFDNHNEVAKLKVPVYRELNCDVVIEDDQSVIMEARQKGLCTLEIGGLSASPLTVFGR